MTPSNTRRPENLALIYQEVLTAIERLRANSQSIPDANAFRHYNREALNSARDQALAAGYNSDDANYATFAVVAFLDESVLNSQNPIFADWLRQPIQEEMFGTHIAGEVFFQNLAQLMGKSDSQDLGDLLEVYYLCLLLGFVGRYRAGGRGERDQIMAKVHEKIRRIRGPFGPLSPAWMLPPGTMRAMLDPWIRKLKIIASVSAGVMLVCFIIYEIILHSGVSAVRALAPAIS
ncbi:MAG TPA: type IVB secretion system protein IcmH/DotU [Bryobacteraceae bacterium]|nr:type IVB secretion system protein IcmH/DotU [Bryobacteraceae bacterium]